MSIARPARLCYTPLEAVRNLSTAPRHGTYIKPLLQPLPPTAQPTVSSEDGHRTLRSRQHGNKSLPLPPLLDSKVIAAREKYAVMKPEAGVDGQTEFQKQLAANPYAQALATPVRQCHLTRARLPTHFLQTFSASITDNPEHAITTTGKKTVSRPIKVSLVPKSRKELPYGSTLPASTYAINRKGLIQYLGKRRAWSRLADLRMQEHYARRIGRKNDKNVDVSKEWAWDEGMPEIVLAQLQKEVVGHLNEVLNAEDDAMAPVADVGSEKWEQVAAVVTLEGSRRDEPKGEQGRAESVSVYALDILLDAEFNDELRARMDHETREWAVFSRQEDELRTMPLLLALARLETYLREGP